MKTEFYRCPICGNIILRVINSGVTPECCGQPMQKLEANTIDASHEKHVPVITCQGKDAYRVTIGSEPHPVTDEHHINFIYLETEHGGQLRYLGPGHPAQADFCGCNGKVKGAFAYCNLHGLWYRPMGGEAERQRGGEAERQRGGEAERQRGGEAERQRGGEAEGQRGGEAERQRGGEAERQRGGEAERQKGGEAEGQRGGKCKKQSCKLMALIALLFPFGACTNALTVDNTPIENLDLDRYLGKWYELARFDHHFEKGLDNCTAMYEYNDDGTVRVTNTGWTGEKWKESVGKAKTTDTPARLRVSFFGPFYSDYRVLMLAKDYSVALVGGSNDKYLWILSRTPQLDGAVLDQVLKEAQRRGYNTNQLVWVNQDYNIMWE